MNPNAWVDVDGGRVRVRVESIDEICLHNGALAVRVRGQDGPLREVVDSALVDEQGYAELSDGLIRAMSRLGTAERPIVIEWDIATADWIGRRVDEPPSAVER